ncbi:MAG TPA: YbhB/YbcL family Raf kinase inhibitor-like protein [Pyrinomonadaceae bacterium]|jgi:hypothetical protein|nr:YbhB/YbcL family Raf kinase inhibitor-like protein [Pyrinomonadaceae bacterium]
MSIKITSSAFNYGSDIPTEFTCDGANISPPLSWSDIPSDAKSLALLVSDPDAPSGTFTHWLLFNLPTDIGGLPENLPPNEKLENGALQGKNGFGKFGYGGPCPPAGSEPHRYFFRFYALDTKLNLGSGISLQEINSAMKSHILDEAELMGKYSRHQAKAAETR